MATSTVVSAFSFGAAAFLSSSRCLRYILLFTAGMSFLIPPFTIVAIAPVNNELFAMHDTHALEAESEEKPSPELAIRERRAIQLIEKWRKLHLVRIVLGAGAWVGGIIAFNYGI